jgi:glutaredoxin-related protein
VWINLFQIKNKKGVLLEHANSKMSSVAEITRTHPIVLIIRGFDVETNQIIANLASIQPPLQVSPMCVDLEFRPDSEILLKELKECTGKETPALYIRGVYLGDYQQVLDLIQSGKLSKLLNSEDLLTNEDKDKNESKECSGSADERDERTPSRTRQGRRQSRFRL